jgi:hypothetical protein
MNNWKSPYYYTSIQSKFLLYYVHRTIQPHIHDSIFKVVNQWVERPDLMALDLYGDPDLWMVFGLRNALKDPYYDLTLGKELIVPSLDHVIKSLV